MRSRSCIQSSACSAGGRPSHLFSMSARVTLEMAYEPLARDWAGTTTEATEEREALRTEERSMDMVEMDVLWDGCFCGEGVGVRRCGGCGIEARQEKSG